ARNGFPRSSGSRLVMSCAESFHPAALPNAASSRPPPLAHPRGGMYRYARPPMVATEDGTVTSTSPDRLSVSVRVTHPAPDADQAWRSEERRVGEGGTTRPAQWKRH